ncbi:hypothetical protein NEHOM01_0164 [Nematocida homosporus]|uniref:uncharacterized protein n=1 Tax=Nematocida homosporus TaxID=1912981 RepID=UPI00221EA6C0|nr:uncharacterized protein NEHOM01_0164 [Nematocida homosporus]KAI5184419.1 hypothetical protein NEHOM01_0164 [Nematocida homosporus]
MTNKVSPDQSILTASGVNHELISAILEGKYSDKQPDPSTGQQPLLSTNHSTVHVHKNTYDATNIDRTERVQSRPIFGIRFSTYLKILAVLIIIVLIVGVCVWIHFNIQEINKTRQTNLPEDSPLRDSEMRDRIINDLKKQYRRPGSMIPQPWLQFPAIKPDSLSSGTNPIVSGNRLAPRPIYIPSV